VLFQTTILCGFPNPSMPTITVLKNGMVNVHSTISIFAKLLAIARVGP